VTNVVLEFMLNGRPESVEVRANSLMLDVIREQFGLTGAKRSCDAQVCGACTILKDGLPVSSCTALAADMDGAEILTIEGLASPGELHPLQLAFVQRGGLQCGFCTPGFILTAHSLIERGVTGDRELIEGLDGNICRCTGYRKIIEAVTTVAGEMAIPVTERTSS
jgi:aerobic-type carbon monoxide dehydrogenase small subunit (CoxS/CutS family)